MSNFPAGSEGLDELRVLGEVTKRTAHDFAEVSHITEGAVSEETMFEVPLRLDQRAPEQEVCQGIKNYITI
jgi:hypothetical protein